METRRLNKVEEKYIERELAPYGDKTLTGGSVTIDDNDCFIYYLSIDGFYPWNTEGKKICARLKETLSADKVYVNAISI